VKQSEIPRDKKWISLFFERVEDFVKVLETHPLMIKTSEWFKPSRGNSIYSIWALDHGRRPDLGAKDFFYFSRDKIDDWDAKVKGFKEAVMKYLVPAITASRYVKTFIFTEKDWMKIRERREEERGKSKYPNAWILVLHEDRNNIPQQLQEYIKWGETECKTQIRATRGGGKICSKAEACKAREKAKDYFYGWYDLGGYIPTPMMAVYQPRYHPQFFLVLLPRLITYHAIITFVPRVKMKVVNEIFDPIEYNRVYGDVIDNIKPSIELDEIEIKALLAYLNSTFNWLWLEQKARYIAKGPLGLEVQVIEDMPIPNIKSIDRRHVEDLAQLFEKLEFSARSIMGDSSNESVSEEEEGVRKLEMFKKLRPIFREIDSKIAEILKINVNVDELWNSAWEMMRRRVEGAGRKLRPGAEIEIEIKEEKESEIRKGRKRRKRSSEGKVTPLTKWFKQGNNKDHKKSS
jgi:hypothetical protein